MRNWSNIKLAIAMGALFWVIVALEMGALYMGWYVHWS